MKITVEVNVPELQSLVYQQLVETCRAYHSGTASDALKRLERLVELQKDVVSGSAAVARGKAA